MAKKDMQAFLWRKRDQDLKAYIYRKSEKTKIPVSELIRDMLYEAKGGKK